MYVGTTSRKLGRPPERMAWKPTFTRPDNDTGLWSPPRTELLATLDRKAEC